MPDLDHTAVHQQKVSLDGDVVVARQTGRRMAEALGFSRSEQALIATAISELARNIVNYAGEGSLWITVLRGDRKVGLQILAQDNGPGIPDIEAALTDGFSTGSSLGLGLPGTRRIMDEFTLESAAGQGVKVTAVKWRLI